MEQYLGLSKGTIIQMRDEYLSVLHDTVNENKQFPNDSLLYTRTKRLSQAIIDLTKELEFRNDDMIGSITAK